MGMVFGRYLLTLDNVLVNKAITRSSLVQHCIPICNLQSILSKQELNTDFSLFPLGLP